MSNYAYIVAACSKYLPEVTALLNSLDYVGNKQDVMLIGIELTDEFDAQLKNLGYYVFHHKVEQTEIEASRGISEVTCRKRYWYAAEFGKGYDAVCVLDADMIFCRNPIQYFDIAAKTGFILGPHKEQNKAYDDDHYFTNGKWEWKTQRGYWNDKDLCNSPVFLDAKLWKTALEKEWTVFMDEGFKGPDMDAMNLSFLEYGGHDKIVKLCGYQWLGTNEQHLKPYIRVVTKNDGKIWSENGTEIFCYHGHYGHRAWRQCQLDNRHRCSGGYLKARDESLLACDNIAKGSMDLLYSHFLKMLSYKIVLEKKNYRHPEEPYEEQ